MAKEIKISKAGAPKPKKSNRMGSVVLALIFALMAVKLLPTTLVIMIGLIPTAAAYIADTSKARDLGATVLAMNVAGMFPALLKLWHGPHTSPRALEIMTQPLMLLMVLIPAGFGWLLFYFVPYLISGLMRRKAEARIKSLEEYQEELVTKWGSEVTYLGNPANAAKPGKSDEALDAA
ncbi:MAG: hypothetical protein JWM96_22 [Alphaproteobacteria bacterium]|nr:hypothetical protein [Alphaproteobacteria bacterium]